MLPVPLAVFFFLFGLFWKITPVEPPADDVEDLDKAERTYLKAKRRQAISGLLRILCLVVGGLFLLLNLVAWPGSVEDWNGFALVFAVYSILMLAVQRAEINRRLATLLILAFAAFIVNSYALGSELRVENTWAIYAALLANYVFWLLIGRRYPPGTSEDIQVWGMDS
jgi:hypothetical protein